MFVVKTFIVVNKRVMRSSEDQPKVNSSSDVHRWHALWHALSDITGKTGPISRGGIAQFQAYRFFAGSWFYSCNISSDFMRDFMDFQLSAR